MPRVSRINIDRLDNYSDRYLLIRFDGGLNDTYSNEVLRDEEATTRQNWGNDENGSLVKVNGYTKANASAMGSKPVRGLFRVYESDGTRKLLAMCDGKLFYSDNLSTFTQEGNSTAYTETDYFSGVNYNDKFFFTGQTENVHVFDPSADTSAAATDQPTDPCKMILKRADRRLLAFVNTVNGSTLYFTKVDPTNSADDWSAANDAGSIAIDGSKSEPLTGGMTFASIDIMFKHYAAFKVWGYPTPQVERMAGSPGCVAPYSVAQGEGLGFHLAQDGVWMWDGNLFIKISDSIKTTIDAIGPLYVQNAFGVYREGKYWLFYTTSGDTVNKSCIIYDVKNSNPYERKNIWYKRTNLEMNSPVVFTGGVDDNELYAGVSADTGFVYKLDSSATGADDTGNISAIYQTKYFNFGHPYLVKRFKAIRIKYYLLSNTIDFTWYTDRGIKTGNYSGGTAGGTALGTFQLGVDTLAGGLTAYHEEKLPDNCTGKDLSIYISSNATGTAPKIEEIEIEWEALHYES